MVLIDQVGSVAKHPAIPGTRKTLSRSVVETEHGAGGAVELVLCRPAVAPLAPPAGRPQAPPHRFRLPAERQPCADSVASWDHPVLVDCVPPPHCCSRRWLQCGSNRWPHDLNHTRSSKTHLLGIVMMETRHNPSAQSFCSRLYSNQVPAMDTPYRVSQDFKIGLDSAVTPCLYMSLLDGLMFRYMRAVPIARFPQKSASLYRRRSLSFSSKY
jgi:hypothetical protein